VVAAAEVDVEVAADVVEVVEVVDLRVRDRM
jgi:hypothetical protein